nr:hypothetical protein CFP56_13241 [Quercus suber]
MNFTATVKVVVGQEKRIFVIYKDIFTSRSDFFLAACASQWKEPDGAIELPEDDPDIFNIYVACVCSADLTGEIVAGNEYTVMIQTYFMADKFSDRRTANLIMDAMITFETQKKSFVLSKNIDLCYRGSMPGSPQRRLLVDLWVHLGDLEQFKRQAEALPTDFVRDVATAFLKARAEQRPKIPKYSLILTDKNFWAARCQYHLHGGLAEIELEDVVTFGQWSIRAVLEGEKCREMVCKRFIGKSNEAESLPRFRKSGRFSRVNSGRAHGRSQFTCQDKYVQYREEYAHSLSLLESSIFTAVDDIRHLCFHS